MAEVELAPDSRLEQNVSSKIDQQTKTESVSFFGLFATADASDALVRVSMALLFLFSSFCSVA